MSRFKILFFLGLWVNDPLPEDIGSPPIKRVAVRLQGLPTEEVNRLLGIQQVD